MRMAWLLWANTVLGDIAHLMRKVAFPPPDEVDGNWVQLRMTTQRGRRPRTKLKAHEQALLLDVGDYIGELRTVETENAATLECLLHAAWLLWDAHGHQPNAGAETIYNHVLNSWGLMPPAVDKLPEEREAVYRLCRTLMRETDLVPNWYFFNEAVPRDLRKADGESKDDTEETEPPVVADLFGGVDP